MVSRRLGTVLKQCDLVKASAEESQVLTSREDPAAAAFKIMEKGPKAVIITVGRKGSILGLKGRGIFLIPSYPEKNVVDPTGAGDVLMGGYLSTLLSTRDPVWAASVGSAFASMIVRNRGLAKFGLSRVELFRRSAKTYNGVGRLGVPS